MDDLNKKKLNIDKEMKDISRKIFLSFIKLESEINKSNISYYKFKEELFFEMEFIINQDIKL